VRDNYANGKFARIESDCTFNDGLRSCESRRFNRISTSESELRFKTDLRKS